MRFERWPKEEIAAAQERLLAEFKDEQWGEEKVMSKVLEQLVKQNNRRLDSRSARCILHSALC
jgi:hypothetical protein